MNRNEIEDMAREAGFGTVDTRILERFAALVAAEERKHCYDLIETLVKAEREACARVCDEVDRRWVNQAEKCAERIRARGEE